MLHRTDLSVSRARLSGPGRPRSLLLHPLSGGLMTVATPSLCRMVSGPPGRPRWLPRAYLMHACDTWLKIDPASERSAVSPSMPARLGRSLVVGGVARRLLSTNGQCIVGVAPNGAPVLVRETIARESHLAGVGRRADGSGGDLTGLRVWEAAPTLIRYLDRHADRILAGKSVLEVCSEDRPSVPLQRPRCMPCGPTPPLRVSTPFGSLAQAPAPLVSPRRHSALSMSL